VLEEDRQAKRIGKGLEAQLTIEASGPTLELLKRHASSLKEFLNVSSVEVVEGKEPKITASPAQGHKCARCWNFMPDTADYGIWHDVCGRCREALKEMGIAAPSPQPTDQNPSAGTPTLEAAQ
jgi:isoleucyl-tRNA synthetase